MSIPDIQEAINLIEEGKPEAAIPLLAQWAEHMPTYVAVHVVLARAHEARHQWPEALAAWQRAHFLMPNSPAVQEGLQRVLAVSSTETEPPEAEALSMDLDLEAELEATLEALFNPFTLPQQSEDIAIEEAAVLDEDTALTEIEEAPGDEETEPLEPLETEGESPVTDEAEALEEADVAEEVEPVETVAEADIAEADIAEADIAEADIAEA
ncbi:MAG: tetratricopeptide repeat protein, partial [Rhodothermales bacterium]